MKELTAKLVLKNLRKEALESGDYNDILNYVELMLANEEEMLEQLNDKNWHISSKFNAKRIYKREIGFINIETKYDENDEAYTVTEKMVHTYIFDGNGSKRICTWGSTETFVDVPYNHRTFEEVMEIADRLKEEAKSVLGNNEEYILSIFNVEDLKEKSEKCYYYEDEWDTYYIPKSVVAINENGQVLLSSWYANKYKDFVAEVPETQEEKVAREAKEKVETVVVGATTQELVEELDVVEERIEEHLLKIEKDTEYEKYDFRFIEEYEGYLKRILKAEFNYILDEVKEKPKYLGELARAMQKLMWHYQNGYSDNIDLTEFYEELDKKVQKEVKKLNEVDYKIYYEELNA